jgi:hypothetical protein
MSVRGVRAAVVATAAAVATVVAGAPAGAAVPLLEAKAPAVELEAARPIAVPGGGEIQRYRQRAGGLPVLGADAVVADPRSGPRLVVSDHTVAGLGRPKTPRLSRSAAIRRAREAAGVERLRVPARARLAVEPRSGATVWEVLVAGERPFADLAVLVDARDGSIVAERDLLRHASGAGAVFAPNPVVTQGSYAGLRDAKDKDSTLLDSLRIAVALERLTSPKGCLSGTYVEARFGKRAKPVCSPGFQFSDLTRSNERFEAVMGYYHLDRTRAYIESLGLSKGLRSKPQRIRVNAIPDDNSFFSPIQRSITTGVGGVDDGEDADVIVHEYGHAIQDQQVHLFGERLEGASMGEGFGDYLAAAMSSLATGGNPQFDPCMFEWDAVSYTSNECARRTDRSWTKQSAERRCFKDPHCLGEAWSSALWELRGVLGPDAEGRVVVDRVLIESHFMLSRTSNFRDGARALLAADELLYAGAHVPVLEAEMAQRGFCKKSGC